MAKFDQHTGQTGWSAADHRQRFYDGLNDRIKDTLSYTDLPIATFDELRDAASKLDKRMRQREAPILTPLAPITLKKTLMRWILTPHVKTSNLLLRANSTETHT